MPYGESDTRAKPVDPAIHACGWTEDLIRREETAGAIEIVEGKPRRKSRGRVLPVGYIQIALRLVEESKKLSKIEGEKLSEGGKP